MQYRITTITAHDVEGGGVREVKHGVLVFGVHERKKFEDTMVALQMAGIDAQPSMRVFAQGGGHLDFRGNKLRHVREALHIMLSDVDGQMAEDHASRGKPAAVAAE